MRQSDYYYNLPILQMGKVGCTDPRSHSQGSVAEQAFETKPKPSFFLCLDAFPRQTYKVEYYLHIDYLRGKKSVIPLTSKSWEQVQ